MRRSVSLLLALLCSPATALAQTPKVAPPIAAPQPPPAVQPPTFYRFDPQHVEVHRVDGRWVLAADSIQLRDFGPREADAHEAQHVIRLLNLNQVGFLGTPLPVMEIWLTDGHAPLGPAQGLNVRPLDLNALHVEHDAQTKQWVLADRDRDRQGGDQRRILFAFGEHAEQAYLALDVMRHYGFSQLGTVGRPFPSMTYFLAHPSEKARFEIQRAIAAQAAPPGTAAANTAGRIRFVPQRVEVRQDDQHQWKLIVGNQVLANFGPDRLGATQALQLVQYYGLTERLTIGTTEDGFHYYLINGQPPVGVRFGQLPLNFRPDSLLVRQQNGQCVVFDGDTPVQSFGGHLADAQQFVRVVQHYHFDRLVSFGGQNGKAMTFLARSH